MRRQRHNSQPRHISIVCLFVCSILFSEHALAGISEWVDMQIDSGHLYVDVEIAGIPGKALIDTGANINAINGRFLEANKLDYPRGRSVEISGVFGTSNRFTYLNVPVNVFGADIEFKGLVDLDLGSGDTLLIIGAGFLELFIFQFDYPNNRMRFITRDSLNLKKVKNIESRRDPAGGAPIVKVRLNDERDLWLLLDTGSNGGVLLDRSVAERYEWLDRYPSESTIYAGVTTTGRMQRFNLPSMMFAGFKVENVIVSVPAEGQELTLFEAKVRTGSAVARRRSKSLGLLGYDVLKHFVVTIDYKAGHIHIALGDEVQESE
jgi:predicted aspartyl protease